MSCKNDIKNKCGPIQYATCVNYELPIPDHSTLPINSCPSLEETTKDLYDITKDINQETDLSSLGSKCLTYIKDADNKIIVKNALIRYEDEICNLKDEITTLKNTALCDKDISSCINTSGLIDPCGDPITTLVQLLQFLTDKHKI